MELNDTYYEGLYTAASKLLDDPSLIGSTLWTQSHLSDYGITPEHLKIAKAILRKERG